MTKTLNVVKPFFMMEPGDTFELSENGMYVSQYQSEYTGSDDEDELKSSYTSKFEISESYAKTLINDGYLTEVVDKKNDFVNVFDEIEKLYDKYADELDNLDEDFAHQPMCLKVEKETVLSNMIKLLDHLHSLKK